MRDDQRDPNEIETTTEDVKTSSPLDRPISRRELGRLALTTGVVLGANALWPKSWETPLVRVGPLPAHAVTSSDAYGLSANATPTSESAFSVLLTQSSGRAFHTVTLEWAKLRNTPPADRSRMEVSSPSLTTPISVSGLEPDTVYYFWVKNVNPSPRADPTVNETYSQPSSARTFAFPAPTVTTTSETSGPTVSWTLPSGALGVELVAVKASGEERLIGAYPSYRTMIYANERPVGWQTGVTFKVRAVAGGKHSAWFKTT